MCTVYNDKRSVRGTGPTVVCEQMKDLSDKGLQPLAQKITIVCEAGNGTDEKLLLKECTNHPLFRRKKGLKNKLQFKR
ncbi:MAG: hypothetical protein OEV44_08045 [Spirochaetota bacterium]|nr:hypothetical protein [Spirochaetota bacterium]